MYGRGMEICDHDFAVVPFFHMPVSAPLRDCLYHGCQCGDLTAENTKGSGCRGNERVGIFGALDGLG